MMPTQLSYPNEERARMNDNMNEALQNLQASKKRKRGSPEQNGVEESGSKRGSMSNTMNGNGDHVNGSSVDSFSDALNNSSNASNEFTNLSHQLHASSNAHDASSTAAAALAAQLNAPQHSDISFVSTGSGTDGERQIDSSFDLGGGDGSQNNHAHGNPYLASFGNAGGTAAQVHAAREVSIGGSVKPTVGSDEWHKVRRDNHKEVERRRRETINEGINELAKIVPGCEKNKGSILQRAVTYILQLKSQQEKAVENRTLEKVLLDQAVTEVGSRNEQYKKELQAAWEVNKRLKERLERAGIRVEEEEGESEGTSD